MHYQPQIDPRTRTRVAVKALLRWQHPQRGLLSPARFITIATDHGMIGTIGTIGTIGASVVEPACLHCAEWVAVGLGPIRLSVNLAMNQFIALDFINIVKQALELARTDDYFLLNISHAPPLMRHLRCLNAGTHKGTSP